MRIKILAMMMTVTTIMHDENDSNANDVEVIAGSRDDDRDSGE